jgi:hypothetical protein
MTHHRKFLIACNIGLVTGLSACGGGGGGYDRVAYVAPPPPPPTTPPPPCVNQTPWDYC